MSRALKDALARLGVPEDKITVLRNGVDLERFAPVARDAARTGLAIDGPVWLSVGHLTEHKGFHIAIQALARTPDVTLLIAGSGREEAALRALADRLQVSERVRFLGHVEHEDLPRYYSAADALVLATASEGMPNVVLEAMACGAAVIATAVGGIPELVEKPVAGVLMDDRTPDAVTKAWQAVCRHGISQEQRDARRRYAERFSWAETTQGQLTLFRRILGQTNAAASAPSDAFKDPAHEAEE